MSSTTPTILLILALLVINVASQSIVGTYSVSDTKTSDPVNECCFPTGTVTITNDTTQGNGKVDITFQYNVNSLCASVSTGSKSGQTVTFAGSPSTTNGQVNVSSGAGVGYSLIVTSATSYPVGTPVTFVEAGQLHASGGSFVQSTCTTIISKTANAAMTLKVGALALLSVAFILLAFV